MGQSRETVFETEWFSVEREFFHGIDSLGGKPYYRINSPDGVMVLAQTREGNILLVKQFRAAINEYTLELPSGSIDQLETPGEAAARELYEETGYVCETLSFLGEGRVMASRNSNRQLTFFGARAVRDPAFKGMENIEVCLAHPSRLRDLVVSGQFQQLAGLAALTLADLKLGTRFLNP